MKIILIASLLCLTSCYETKAEETKEAKETKFTNLNAGYYCRTMGAMESCGLRLYDCTSGSIQRFDVICATNVTVERF